MYVVTLLWNSSIDKWFFIIKTLQNNTKTELKSCGDNVCMFGSIGLKVIGGKMTEEGRLGAFITRVKEGSIADTVGHLQSSKLVQCDAIIVITCYCECTTPKPLDSLVCYG